MSRSRRRLGAREGSSQPSPPRTLPEASCVVASIVDDADITRSWREFCNYLNTSIQATQAQRPYSSPWSSLSDSWNDYLLPLTIYRFSFGMINGQSQTLPEFISSSLDKVDSNSALYLAYKAIGCAYHAKRLGNEIASASRPVNAHYEALSVVRSLLADPENCKDDSTVLAVWFLGLFEVMVSTQDERAPRVVSPGWEFHSKGLITMIHERGLEQFSRQDGRDLFWVISTTIVSLPKSRPAFY
ncbi:hypothetical protein BGW36DRAFT_361226 [Talaromyces proteolyticus]|uniref:Uncharacterized protein n=1 Tax=Talaromyces proteolyticus TaxID=1131652 RepID=A0AAD4PZ93_9EURO|nr:uncharacterized protein BGW36DRAFT_361226 [Talaromyces proteolyticus]KAH8695532.1 hypothetical protein BGW36DRAFT_361226 [Talaromyces proteolyticus]